MQPLQDLMNKISAAIGADTTSLAGALKVGLVKTDITPGLDAELEAADEATFPGYAAKTVVAATRPDAYDPATMDRLVTVQPPAGGFIWETSGAPDPAETIYGYYVGADTIGAGTIWAYDKFEQPIQLTLADQQVALDQVFIRLLSTGVV